MKKAASGKKSSSSKKVVFNSVIYTLSGLLTKCFSFFLLPLYTVYLTTEDYGITSIATSFLTTAGFIVAFSLFSAVIRFYVDLKDEPEKLSRFYGSVSGFVFVSGIFFGLLLTVFRGALSKYVFSGIDYYPVILICLISLVFHCQHTIFDNILRSQQKALKSSVFSLLFFFSTVLFNILFVVVFKMGAVGSLLATLISCVWYTLYFVIEMSVKKAIHYCFDKELLKSALKYSIPIMPHNLSTHIAVLVSKVLIGDIVSLSGVGIYSVASQFGHLADTIQGYVDHAYGPWMYEQLHENKAGLKSTIRNTSRLLISVIGLFFIGISLFAQDYVVLLEKSYADAWKYVPFIVSVFAIKTMYYFYVEVLFYYKEASKKLFWSTLSSSFANILFSFFLIPAFGIYGSILADIIAMILRVAIVYLISRKYDIGLHLTDFIINLGTVLLFIAVGLIPSYIWFPHEFSIINFAYKIFIVLVYIGLLMLVHRKRLFPMIKSVIAKLKNRSSKGKNKEIV